ncbi:MAG: YaaL family protein [Defluviitaleaceae bacterium]|nr:YaaL family protein [Defluviitaleaceae bacterium]
MSAQAYNHHGNAAVKEKRTPFAKKKRHLDPEDAFILATLDKLKKDLDNIHRALDSVTDPILIDSFIYEISAINMRYKFYLQQCKERELIGDMFQD